MKRVRALVAFISLLLIAIFHFPLNLKAEGRRQASFCVLKNQSIAPLESRPAFSLKNFGAIGDGESDDTLAIQKALDEVPQGSVLIIPSGTYLHKTSLVLSKKDVVIQGNGGIFKGINPKDQALVLQGDQTAVVGLIMHGSGDRRLSTPQTTKIKVTGRYVQVLNNEIIGGASAGIFIFGGSHFRVEGNTVRDTLADGIHMTFGASNGIVQNNLVYRTGDDPIAVVSYVGDSDDGEKRVCHNIYIHQNDVSDVSWGRGITVVGGEHISIIDNNVSRIHKAAGILISQEEPSRTVGVKWVLIKDNVINDIMVDRSAGHPKTGHGAIDVNSYNQYPVEQIEISGNKIQSAYHSGIRVLGDVCDVSISNNKMRNVGRNPIQVEGATCPSKTIICNQNSVDQKKTGPCFASRVRTPPSPHIPDFSEMGVWAQCAQE